MQIEELVKTLRAVCINHFDELAKRVYQDMGIEMITFVSKTINDREVDNGFANIDTEWDIGIDRSGWVLYISTLEYGGTRKRKLIEDEVKQMSDTSLIKYFSSEYCSVKDFSDFMGKYLAIFNKYRKEFIGY